jgi:hypothetical protein
MMYLTGISFMDYYMSNHLLSFNNRSVAGNTILKFLGEINVYTKIISENKCSEYMVLSF